MNIIVGKNITRAYRHKTTMNDMSFTIKENTITGIIGRNGAGKTTMLKMIAGFWKPTKGEVKVFGEDAFQNLFVSGNSIFVDDQMTFPSSFSLEEILQSCAPFYPNWNGTLAINMLDYFELPRNGGHHHLSKGQKSTLHMIIGLAARCPLTIFDEPTTGMDSTVRKDFYRALLKDYIAFPRTILLSSHQIDEIEHLLEDVLLVDRGEKVLHLPIDEVNTYAVAVTGNPEKLQLISAKCDILHETTDMVGDRKMIVRNNASLQELELDDINLEHVPVDQLAAYISKGHKGGIDHVFQ